MANREDFIRGLREMADFFESHEEMPMPTWRQVIDLFATGESSRQQMVSAAKAMGKANKGFNEELITLSKNFGDLLTLKMHAYREQICERIVIATEEIPEEIIPERVVKAHVREKVEWRCEPLLGER
jgi:hypothetical protein